MRSYFTLLRLPYQLQLGPIFGWGYLLAGGHFQSGFDIWHFLVSFIIFHVGAFGGLTALNSFYDRDSGPIGGLWQPPAPPAQLWAFAWCVQLGGLFCLIFVAWQLTPIYAVLLLLSLGYSHPRPRWKGHAWKSLATVVAGQGILDFLAGALTANSMLWQKTHLSTTLWCGMAGATLMVAGFYPLTQLYQVSEDQERGDYTLAYWLVTRIDRKGVFAWAGIVTGGGIACNVFALLTLRQSFDAILLLLAGIGTLGYLWNWHSAPNLTPRDDFQHIHGLMHVTAMAFGCYILLRLLMGGVR